MFIYRMEYDDSLYGIYHGDFNNECEIDNDKRRNCFRILVDYDKELQKSYGIEVHPIFTQEINDTYHFGFDSNTKFMRWFPEVVLKNIIKEKSEHLKFRIYDAPEDCIVSDETQCQFDRNKSNNKCLVSILMFGLKFTNKNSHLTFRIMLELIGVLKPQNPSKKL